MEYCEGLKTKQAKETYCVKGEKDILCTIPYCEHQGNLFIFECESYHICKLREKENQALKKISPERIIQSKVVN